MSTVRAMAVFQGHSGLPEDQYVNTFYFIGGGTYSEDLLLARAAVEDFYITPGGTAGYALGKYMSPWVDRPFKIKTYDMSAPKVRVPTTYDTTLGGGWTTEGAPEECAVVLSLHGSTPPASARRRGRLYIGPLGMNALTVATTTARSGVSPAFVSTLLAAATRLVDTPLVQWSIRSVTPSENYVAIVGGYVDDALDTQIRRGPAPTVRTPFVSTP